MIIRFRYQQLGGHIHVRVFMARGAALTFEKNGELVFDEREWAYVRDALRPAVEFIPEDPKP